MIRKLLKKNNIGFDHIIQAFDLSELSPKSSQILFIKPQTCPRLIAPLLS